MYQLWGSLRTMTPTIWMPTAPWPSLPPGKMLVANASYDSVSMGWTAVTVLDARTGSRDRFRPISQGGSWEFVEEGSGRWGWVSTADPSAPKESRSISFKVEAERGEIVITYLRSYENMGCAEVTISPAIRKSRYFMTDKMQRETTHTPVVAVLDGRWDLPHSLPCEARIMVPVFNDEALRRASKMRSVSLGNQLHLTHNISTRGHANVYNTLYDELLGHRYINMSFRVSIVQGVPCPDAGSAAAAASPAPRANNSKAKLISIIAY